MVVYKNKKKRKGIGLYILLYVLNQNLMLGLQVSGTREVFLCHGRETSVPEMRWGRRRWRIKKQYHQTRCSPIWCIYDECFHFFLFQLFFTETAMQIISILFAMNSSRFILSNLSLLRLLWNILFESVMLFSPSVLKFVWKMTNDKE